MESNEASPVVVWRIIYAFLLLLFLVLSFPSHLFPGIIKPLCLFIQQLAYCVLISYKNEASGDQGSQLIIIFYFSP